MTAEERIITSVRTADGSYVDGSYAIEMFEDTLKSGIEIKEIYADKAYFRKSILDNIKGMDAKAYIPLSSSVYRIDEEEYTYNKDSDEWQCSQGNMTVLKRFHGLSRAKGYSLLGVSKQSKLAAIAVNIKRIAAIATAIFANFWTIRINNRLSVKF